MVVMDGVTSSSRNQSASVRCTGNGGSFEDIRITAVKIGSLTTFDNSGMPHTQGTGTPKAYFRAADAPISLTNANNTLAGGFVIGPGKWMFLAKAQVSGGPIGCQLRTISDYDRSELDPAGHIATAVVHTAAAGEFVHLDCMAPNATSMHPEIIRGAHVTGFLLGSLQNVGL